MTQSRNGETSRCDDTDEDTTVGLLSLHGMPNCGSAKTLLPWDGCWSQQTVYIGASSAFSEGVKANLLSGFVLPRSLPGHRF